MGQRVAVQALLVENGWRWFYEIDGGPPVTTLATPLASEAEAFATAAQDAKRRINVMKGM